MPARLRLRDVTAADLPVFYEHQQDPAATRMAAFPPRDKEAFFAHWQRILGDDTVVTRTVVVDGEVVGNVVSFERQGRREVGYWIGQRHWGQGVATAPLGLFLAETTARPLYAGVARHNVASIRVLEKCGFVHADPGQDPETEGTAAEMLLMVLPGSRA